MDLIEKVTYIKTLAKQANLDENDPQGKLMISMLEIIDELATIVNEHDEVIESHDEVIADICDDFDELGSTVMQIMDEKYGDEIYEITCPKCEKIISKEFNEIMQGEIACPNCGANIEFDFEEFDDEHDCGGSCNCHHE